MGQKSKIWFWNF